MDGNEGFLQRLPNGKGHLGVHVVKTTNALSDYLQENFDKDRSGCLSPEEIQAGLHKLRQDLPKLTDAGQRASMTYIMGLMLYAQLVRPSHREAPPEFRAALCQLGQEAGTD